MKDDNDLLSVAAVAKLLGYKSRQAVNYLIRTGKLPATRLDSFPRGRWVIKWGDVKKFLEERDDKTS
jgi:hypothetical protein